MEKASKLEKKKVDQQLSGIAHQLSSSDVNTVAKGQENLISYWIAKIEEDFDVIDCFFSNPYKYSATSMLKAQFYKDAEAYKEEPIQCYSIKDSSVDNLQGNSSVGSKVLRLPDEENLHANEIEDDNFFDSYLDDILSLQQQFWPLFDPYHDDMIFSKHHDIGGKLQRGGLCV